MKSRFILLTMLAATAFTSCSVYRSGQTPDDVYYSPGREGAEYVQVDQQRDGQRYDSRYNDNDYYDERWLRMRVRNPNRWNTFDDYSGYNNWYSPYGSMGSWNSWNNWGLGIGVGYSPFYYGNYWNNYYNWNSWYNPYCYKTIVVNPKGSPASYTRVRDFSLGSYTNNSYNKSNAAFPANRYSGARYYNTSGSRYNNSNSRGGLGNSLRKVFSGNNSGRDSYYSPNSGDRPNRTYTPSNNSTYRSSSSTPSSSGGSSSGGRSSGGGGVSRPTRN